MIKDLVKWGLDGKSGPEGCIFPDTNLSGAPEDSAVSVEGPDIPFSLSPLLSFMCSTGIYESNEISGSLPERKRQKFDNLSG